MYQKGLSNIAIVIIVVAVALLAYYFMVARTKAPSEAPQEPMSSQGEPITGETMTVNLYFSNSNIKPVVNCDEVVAEERVIPKTEKVGTAALNELLKGPTEKEKADGYGTAIPEGSKLNSLVIKEGVARADFNATTESGGGSCSMTARTAQIRETLLQFPTVTSVRISVNGEDNPSAIFQP